LSVSYWTDKNAEHKKLLVDICIVGGGLSGLSTAYWLNKEDPNLKIAILEKGQLGSGATGRNAGFITCGSVEHFNRMVSKYGEQQALEIWRFAERNMQLLQTEIFANGNTPQSFKQNGAFSLAASDSEFTELQQVAKLMQRNQIPVEVLLESTIRDRLGATGFCGGIKYLKDGEVDPIELLKILSKQVNAALVENCEVAYVEPLVGGLRKVFARGLEVETTLVIYCTNGYSAALDPYFADKIYPTRGQIMVFEPVKPFMEGPCYANFYLDYFRQLQDGSLLIGGFRQLQADTERGFSEHTTETIQQALHDFVRNHLPRFNNCKVSHRWAGVMGFSVDGEPMVGALPTDNQVFFMGGFTGHGIGMAFHTAKVLVDLIHGRTIPDWLSAKRL
jgi:glycine/D-amino acid oxidase-like deaminating enzyme